MKGNLLETRRLLLRRWRESDLEPFAAMNADPAVMEFFPHPLDRVRSDALARAADAAFDVDGYGLWAVEVKGEDPFVGFVGVRSLAKDPDLELGEAEVGWRLARRAWGKGYATEAARASLEHGFVTCGLAEVVSFTSEKNLRSQKVMQRLGMRRDARADFDHPRIDPGHPLRRHVLYRLSATEWSAQASSSVLSLAARGAASARPSSS